MTIKTPAEKLTRRFRLRSIARPALRQTEKTPTREASIMRTEYKSISIILEYPCEGYDIILASMPQPSFKIEWDAHEYEHKERSSDWFWAVGIISVSVAIASVIFGNIIFGILVLISAFALSLFINRPPSTLHIIVDEKGVTRGKIRYPFSTLQSFWIDTEHPHKD